jgi:hypothetical protein
MSTAQKEEEEGLFPKDRLQEDVANVIGVTPESVTPASEQEPPSFEDKLPPVVKDIGEMGKTVVEPFVGAGPTDDSRSTSSSGFNKLEQERQTKMVSVKGK